MKVPFHIVQARRAKLAQWLQQQGHLSLQAICAQFGISEATARRDLAALEAEKQIVRTYGGALAEYNARFASFRERQQVSAAGKALIAEKALAQIAPETTLFLDAGTTVYTLAELLKSRGVAPLTVVTNSLPVANTLAGTPSIRVHLLGGELLPRQSVLAGRVSLKTLNCYEIDLAFLSAEGINRQGAWNSQKDVVAFQEHLLRRAGKSFLCVDATKIGRTAPVFLAPWERFTGLITDASGESLARLAIPEAKIF